MSLTTEEFHAAVLSLNPHVAVFDCDGTLWSGDAGSGFMRYTMECGLLSQERIAWMRRRYDAYCQGQVPELAICGEMVQVYAGLRESEVRAAAASFFTEFVEGKIFPGMLELVGELARRRVDIWAVSSTNNWVVEEGMRRFNVPAERVLAARVEIDDERATDRLIAVPTDEWKVAALEAAGVSVPDCVFGNSIHDAAMLARAGSAFAVNPTPALRELAAARLWAVYQP